GAISWGVAPAVARGSCATPVVGSVTGDKLTCSVLFLGALSRSQFQLVAFRGTLNTPNTVFGGLSNVASGTTAVGSTPPPPAGSGDRKSVAEGESVDVGGGGTLKEANGKVLRVRRMIWWRRNKGE